MREAVAHLQACHGMSERRACRVIDADRKSVRYRSTRDDDAGVREKLRDLANQRRRFGYRRLHILLRREGVMINRKKTSAVAMPASCSFKIAMICSSLNLLRFISSDSLRQTLPKSGHISGEHVTRIEVARPYRSFI